MDEDKLKDLFSDFEPELSASTDFMDRLQRNMDAVEIVRQYSLAQKKRNRLAVVIAALSGFVAGVILTLLYPLIGSCISTFNIAIPHVNITSLTIDYSYAGWLLIAAVCVITALNAYEIALARLTPKTVDYDNRPD